MMQALFIATAIALPVLGISYGVWKVRRDRRDRQMTLRADWQAQIRERHTKNVPPDSDRLSASLQRRLDRNRSA